MSQTLQVTNGSRTVSGSAAKSMNPQQRQQLAVQALARTASVSRLSQEHEVSRKFVQRQTATARQALDEAFDENSKHTDDKILFHIPVTKKWLRQLVLALVLICRSSYRGVQELLRDLLQTPLSLGTIHNIVHGVVAQADKINRSYNLADVRIGAHDEIFQSGAPVLTGIDTESTFLYLLSLEEQRDADTWGVRLLELQDRGFAPDATIADAASGLRSGQRTAMPNVPCRGDLFHALRDFQQVVSSLDQRACTILATVDKLMRQQQQHEQKNGRKNASLSLKLRHARASQDPALVLADDLALLYRWFAKEVLAVDGRTYQERRELYDFILAELQARIASCAHRLQPLHTYLKNQRGHLLAFAQELDQNVASLAGEFRVDPARIRDLLDLQAMNPYLPQRWQKATDLQRQLGSLFYPLNQAVEELADAVVRSSSFVENVNSRLRNHFFLRKNLGSDYLTLLQFFFNHRRYPASEHPDRLDKSPAELLTGHKHSHWLEMLGYRLFQRN